MPQRYWGIVLVIFSAFALLPTSACQRERAQKSASRQIPRRAANEQEAKALAEQIIAAVKSASPEQAARFVDWSELAGRGIRDLDLPDDQKQSFTDGVVQGVGQGFFGNVRDAIARGGSYTLLQNRMIGKERRIKIRQIDAQGAFNYHDFVVEVLGNQARAIDVHVLFSGEPLSATVGRLLLPLVAEQSKSLLERLKKRDADYLTHLKKLQVMGTAVQSNPRQTLSLYRELPAKMQKEKAVQLTRIRAASALDEAEYLSALEDFRKMFPQDIAVDVISLDYFVLRKKYADALAALKRIETREGRDAYLDVMRANTQFLNGDLDAAIESARQALQSEPDLAPATRTLLALELQKGDQKAAAETLSAGEARNVNFADFAPNPAFQALRQSKHYKTAQAAQVVPPGSSDKN